MSLQVSFSNLIVAISDILKLDMSASLTVNSAYRMTGTMYAKLFICVVSHLIFTATL